MSTKIAKKPFLHPVLLLFLTALIAGCSVFGKQPTEVSHAVTPTVWVIPSGEPSEKRVISTETIPQNNCGGSAGVSSTVERSRSIVYTLEVGGEISVNASGSAGVPGIGEMQVGAEVAAKYGVSYGQEETLSRSLTVSAKEGTNILHTLQQVEYWEIGELVIVAGEKSLSYPYSFRKDFGVELVKSKNMGCPGSTPESKTTITPGLTVTTASIDFPLNGTVVGESVIVRGVISGLGPNQRAFLCIKSQAFSRRTYPQGEIFPNENNHWAIESIYRSIGYSYETFVVVTSSSEAAKMLSDSHFRTNGMDSLPQDVVIISPVIVVTRE